MNRQRKEFERAVRLEVKKVKIKKRAFKVKKLKLRTGRLMKFLRTGQMNFLRTKQMKFLRKKIMKFLRLVRKKKIRLRADLDILERQKEVTPYYTMTAKEIKAEVEECLEKRGKG